MNDTQTTSTDADLERLGRAVLREAGLLNDPKIQDDVHQRTGISMVYARRYAAAVVRELRTIETERASG